MEVITADHWDELLWQEAEPIYYGAFPESGRKNRSILRNMFQKQLGNLHLAKLGDQPVAMAITGKASNHRALILDYFAVRSELRGKASGPRFCSTSFGGRSRKGSMHS